MVAAKKRPAKKRAVTTAKLNVTKTPAAKKTARPRKSADKGAASTIARMPSGQSPQIAVPPAHYPWLHFTTARTAGGTVSDPDAVAAVERQFEQWRRGLQRETRSAAQAAVGSRARHEAETIGFCADAMLDSMRLIHLMRFASHDDRGTPRAKVVDKESTRLEEATIGWKYHADGPFIGLFPVQPQPITFGDFSEDTFTAFAHLLACWHLEQIKQVRQPRTFQLREPELERLFELLAEYDFPTRVVNKLSRESAHDNQKIGEEKLPLNSDIRDLCLYLKTKQTKFGSNIECVRDFCRVNKITDKKPEYLFRQAQRFPHLWQQ